MRISKTFNVVNLTLFQSYMNLGYPESNSRTSFPQVEGTDPIKWPVNRLSRVCHFSFAQIPICQISELKYLDSIPSFGLSLSTIPLRSTGPFSSSIPDRIELSRSSATDPIMNPFSSGTRLSLELVFLP